MDANHVITILVTVFASTGFWTFLNAFIERKTRKRSSLENGVIGLLHDRVYELARKYIADGNISHSEYENLHKLYDPYKEMGGNGTAEKLMNEIEKLPIVED